MQSTNLSKKIPKQISFYYTLIDTNIFKDNGFIEINNLLSQKDNLSKYSYCLYTDTNLLKPNIFAPIFDTLYLASRNHNVVLNSTRDFWLVEMYPQNKYFYLGTEAYENNKIQQITSITEI